MFKKLARSSGQRTDAEASTQSPLKSMKLPNKENALGDKIAQAKGESGAFQYVTITGHSKETRKKRIMRLISSRPAIVVDEHEITSLPVVHLINRKETFLLKDCIDAKTLKESKSYIHMEEARIQLTPTQGFYESYAEISIGIRDARLAQNQMVRSVIAETNKPSLCMFSLDYSIHKNDIEDISLVIECSNSPLLPGKIWASCQMQIKLQFSDAARPVMLEPTVAVLEMPQSTMVRPKINPSHVSLAMDDEDLTELRKFYKDKRIIDHSLPVEKQQLTGLGGSEVGSEDQEEGVVSKYLKSMENVKPVSVPDGLDSHRSRDDRLEAVAENGEPSVVVEDLTEEEKELARNTISNSRTPDEMNAPRVRHTRFSGRV